MTEKVALLRAYTMIRQIGRGDISEDTRKWAYEQVDFLISKVRAIDAMEAAVSKEVITPTTGEWENK